MSEGPCDRRGQVWEEDFNASMSFLFLVIGEGTIHRMDGKPMPTYKLLDLETGALDEVPQRTLDVDDDDHGNSLSRGWRRVT